MSRMAARALNLIRYIDERLKDWKLNYGWLPAVTKAETNHSLNLSTIFRYIAEFVSICSSTRSRAAWAMNWFRCRLSTSRLKFIQNIFHWCHSFSLILFTVRCSCIYCAVDQSFKNVKKTFFQLTTPISQKLHWPIKLWFYYFQPKLQHTWIKNNSLGQ